MVWIMELDFYVYSKFRINFQKGNRTERINYGRVCVCVCRGKINNAVSVGEPFSTCPCLFHCRKSTRVAYSLPARSAPEYVLISISLCLCGTWCVRHITPAAAFERFWPKSLCIHVRRVGYKWHRGNTPSRRGTHHISVSLTSNL